MLQKQSAKKGNVVKVAIGLILALSFSNACLCMEEKTSQYEILYANKVVELQKSADDLPNEGISDKVTGLDDLPEKTSPLPSIQMSDDDESNFKLFLRNKCGWHPRGEQKKNIAITAPVACCFLFYCFVSCNCCCGKYGSFECDYCHTNCNCCIKNDYWDE